MNDNDYLDLCNDLKRQYDTLKSKYDKELYKIKTQHKKELCFRDELIEHLRLLLQSQPCKDGQFDSIRPSAQVPRYVYY